MRSLPAYRSSRGFRPLIEQGLAQRGERPDSATVERVPLLIETHPDVWAIVPDPVRPKEPVARPVIHIGQLRAVQRAAYFKPQGRRRVFILDGADTMRWDLASIFLKVLEEPPESATLILLAPNPFQLLPTIVAMPAIFFLAPGRCGSGRNSARSDGNEARGPQIRGRICRRYPPAPPWTSNSRPSQSSAVMR